MTLSPGTRLGPYEILSPLGAGGMGEVYRARDPRLGREVAVKVLPAALSSDPDRLRRFEQEARAAGALNHPNLLTIFDVGTAEAEPHKGAPYLVSELLEGETLRERLSGGALPVRKAIDYAIQAAQGLAAAHEKGIIHRDLKPENLFVTHEGRLKILDFGLAKLKQTEPGDGRLSEMPTTPMRDGPGVMRGTEPGVVMGTMGYMSPEQVRGLPVDPRSDLFSLGAILYEMLAGKRAFQGATTADTMSAILKEDPPELSASGREVPPALIRMVAHCLEKTPQQRYQSARDLAFALETLSGITNGSGALVRGAAGFGESALATAVARLLPRSGWPRVSMVAVALALAAGAGILAGLRLGTKSAEGLGSDSEPARVSYHRLTFRRGSIPAARFAPDGRTVVYSGAWDGALPEIFLTSPDSPESRALGVSGADLLGVSSSGELAVLLRPRWEGNYYLRLGTLARLPLAGGAPRQVLEDVRYADWAPDGKSLAIVRGLGDRERLEYPIGKSLYETSARIVSPRISPAGDRIAFFEMRPGECSVKVADHSGEVRTLSGGWYDWWYLTWSPDGEEVWFAASPKGSSSPIYAVDLSGRLRVLAKAPGSLEIHDVSREGRALVTRVSIRSFMAGRTPGGRVERDLSWLDGSRPVDVSGDGRTLLFMEMFEAGGQYSGIYIRSMDGAPPVRLGEGRALGLSPDGQWVLAYRARDPKELLALPTGPGEARQLKTGALEHVEFAEWLPDGRRILVSGNEPGGRARLYLLDFEGGEPQPLIHEGFSVHPAGRQIAPDGRHVAAIAPDGSLVLCPTGEGKPQPVRGTLPGDRPIQWSPDGRLLYVFRQGEMPGRIYKVDLAGGRRELFKELRPLEIAGVSGIDTVIMTPDGQSYFYSYGQPLAELYLVEGLR